MKIILDAMGGDNGPDANIKGAVNAINKVKAEVILVGKEEVIRNKSASTKLYAGLFVTFMNGSNTDLIKQIHASRRYALNGLILFDYAHLKDSYIDTLTKSVFKPNSKDYCLIDSQTSANNNIIKNG